MAKIWKIGIFQVYISQSYILFPGVLSAPRTDGLSVFVFLGGNRLTTVQLFFLPIIGFSPKAVPPLFLSLFSFFIFSIKEFDVPKSKEKNIFLKSCHLITEEDPMPKASSFSTWLTINEDRTSPLSRKSIFTGKNSRGENFLAYLFSLISVLGSKSVYRS